MYFRQFLTYVAADLNGIGSCLFGNNQTDGFTPIGFLSRRKILDSILDRSYITDENLLSLRCHSYHQILYLGGLQVLRTNLHLVLLLRHLDGTGGEVEVIRRNDLTYLLQRDTIGIEFLLVDIDIYISVRRTVEREVTDTVHLVELRDDLVIEDLVQTRVGLVCRDGVHTYRHRGRRELEDHRRTAVVRQIRLRHIDVRTHIVNRLVHVSAPLQLQFDHRDIILTLRSDVFEVIDGGQGILHDLRHVGLHLGSRCARIGGHDRDIRRVHLRELVNRQFQETVYTDDDNRHEDEGGGHRFLDC